MATGQWITSNDGTRWFFDPGSQALDFGYTGDYGYGVPEWEHLHSPADLESWLVDRFGRLSTTPTETDLTAALRLRAAISRIALGLADRRRPAPADVDTVNEVALVPPPAPHLEGGTTQKPPPDVPAALSMIARDAITVFTDAGPRIRRCAAEDCALVFHDTSRPGSRRWCSMRRCGNRAKTRTHRARTPGDVS